MSYDRICEKVGDVCMKSYQSECSLPWGHGGDHRNARGSLLLIDTDEQIRARVQAYEELADEYEGIADRWKDDSSDIGLFHVAAWGSLVRKLRRKVEEYEELLP